MYTLAPVNQNKPKEMKASKKNVKIDRERLEYICYHVNELSNLLQGDPAEKTSAEIRRIFEEAKTLRSCIRISLHDGVEERARHYFGRILYL